MPISAHRALRTTARGLIAALFLLAFGRAQQAQAQALIKVNDNINFRLGIFLQPQLDFQEVLNATNDGSGGYQQNILIRRARFIVGGQVAKDVFFFFDTENSSLGKSTQTVGGTTGGKSLGTGFNVLDAVGEWRIAKVFNIEFGEIIAPINRWIPTSSSATFMLDQSAYNILQSTPLQNNGGRDTGVMFRGYFFCDRLEYRSAILGGLRQPGVKNSPRFTERLQYNFFDTEVYNLPGYSGVNYGNKKILALGAAYDTQGDFRFGSADLFLDFPIDLGSFESTIAYQYINGGTFITSLPEQNTFSAEGGIFIKGAGVAALARYEQKTFTQTISQSKNENRVALGLNFYPYPKTGNAFNIKFWWQRVAQKCGNPTVPATAGCPATAATGHPTNEFTVQMQVFYF